MCQTLKQNLHKHITKLYQHKASFGVAKSPKVIWNHMYMVLYPIHEKFRTSFIIEFHSLSTLILPQPTKTLILPPLLNILKLL